MKLKKQKGHTQKGHTGNEFSKASLMSSRSGKYVSLSLILTLGE